MMLPDGWDEESYDPERDEAPEGDEDHDCDGTDDDEDVEPKPIKGGAGSGRADTRGWGPGWPNCQGSKWVTLVRSDSIRLPVHREIKTLVALLCDETERLGYNLVPGWCWGAACRPIRGSSSPSNHSWGLAVDLNAPNNPMGNYHPPRTDMPGWMPNLWNRFGFRWGGDYSGRTDAMHYEFMGTPEDASRLTAQALTELRGDDLFEDKDRDTLAKIAATVGDIEKYPDAPTLIDAIVEKVEGKYVDGIKQIRVEIKELKAAIATLQAPGG